MTFSKGLGRFVAISFLATLHLVVTWGVFLLAFGSTMSRFDDPRDPQLLEHLLDLSVRVLLFPLNLVLEHFPNGWFPGLWGYVPLALNSALWGVMLYLLLSQLRRGRRQLRAAMNTAGTGKVAIVLTVVVGPVGGCTDTADTDVGGFHLSDSAGVVIGQSHGPSWNESNSGWVVESEPALTIGKESGEDPYLFSGVVGAVRLSNGDIVVADLRSRELRYFDSEGMFRFSAGGQGQGPGELPTLSSLSRCSGDTLYAFDHRNRARLFDEAGKWLRTLPQITTPAGGPPQALSCGSAGRFLIVGWDPDQMERIEGYYRIRPPVRLHDEEGDVLAEYGTFPSWEYVSVSGGARPHIYSHRLVHVLAEERVYIGTGDAYELRMFDLSGELERIVRWSGPDLTFTDADLERYRDRRLAEIPADRRAAIERDLQEWIRPETWPAYQALAIDPEGFVWVQSYDRTPEDGTAPDWTVLTPEGRVLGRVSIPDGLEVTEIGTDYVLGVLEDSLGVERVALYRLIKVGD